MIDTSKHIWEGWTVQDFIDELEWEVDIIMDNGSMTSKFRNKFELKMWCMDNQPYYKKHIPEVVNYFAKKYGLH